MQLVQPTIESIQTDLHRLAERLGVANNAFGATLDKLSGSSPKSDLTGLSQGTAIEASMLQSMQATVRLLEGEASRFEANGVRLSRAIARGDAEQYDNVSRASAAMNSAGVGKQYVSSANLG